MPSTQVLLLQATAQLTPVTATVFIKVMAKALQHVMWALGEVLAALAVPQEGMGAGVAPNAGTGGADAFSGDGPRYITNEYGDVLGTEPCEAR